MRLTYTHNILSKTIQNIMDKNQSCKKVKQGAFSVYTFFKYTLSRYVQYICCGVACQISFLCNIGNEKPHIGNHDGNVTNDGAEEIIRSALNNLEDREHSVFPPDKVLLFHNWLCVAAAK